MILLNDVSKWHTSRDCGESSRAMLAAVLFAQGNTFAAAMVVGNNPRATPWDASDLGRCIRLIEAIPEVGANLAYVAELSPQWGAIVDNWTALVAQYHADLPTGRSVATLNRLTALRGQL